MEFKLLVSESIGGVYQDIFFAFCKLEGWERQTIEVTKLNTITIKLKMFSKWIKAKKYVYDVNNPQKTSIYSFDYNVVYSQEERTYEKGFITVENKGNRPCAVKVELINGPRKENPKISIGDEYANTTNAFGVNTNGETTSEVILNSYDKELEITVAGNNAEQERDFNKISFIKVPIGKQRIYFEKIEFANVYLYEEFNDLDGVDYE